MGESREKRTSYALGMNNGYGGVKLAKQVGVSGIGDIIPP